MTISDLTKKFNVPTAAAAGFLRVLESKGVVIATKLAKPPGMKGRATLDYKLVENSNQAWAGLVTLFNG